MIALLAASGPGLDRLLGEPARRHPLVLFGACARRIELTLQSRAVRPRTAWGRALGVLALVLAVAPGGAPVCALAAGLPGAGREWRRLKATLSSVIREGCA